MSRASKSTLATQEESTNIYIEFINNTKKKYKNV